MKRKSWLIAISCVFLLSPMSNVRAVAESSIKVIRPPTKGKVYHGVFPCAQGGAEDVTRKSYRSYKKSVGAKAAWIYFSHNWFEGHRFPVKKARQIRRAGAVPFIRLMLRSSEDQDVRERHYTLDRIIRGKFDPSLRRWARGAKKFRTPLLVEYGTEVNGRWFAWNGWWNGRGRKRSYGNRKLVDGPEKFRDAYRHIVNIVRQEGADNISWVFHVNDESVPEKRWNRIKRYYPGDKWVDWIGVSVYGPGSPLDDENRSFRKKMDRVYPKLTSLNAAKPIVLLEFGATLNHPRVDQARWADKALRDIIKRRRWRRLVGFSWWNEAWENDNNPDHDTTMRVQDNPDLARIFRKRLRTKNVLGRPRLK